MASLIIYGSPPETSTFTSGITPKNRHSFEALLVPELEKLAGFALKPVTVRPICEAKELGALIKGGVYEHVVFYGHAYTFTTGSRNEMKLATACDKSISAQQFAEALQGSTGVKDVLLAGCDSNAFAADLTIRVPTIRFGGLMAKRNDDIRGNAKAIERFQILPQAVKWWRGGK